MEKCLDIQVLLVSCHPSLSSPQNILYVISTKYSIYIFIQGGNNRNNWWVVAKSVGKVNENEIDTTSRMSTRRYSKVKDRSIITRIQGFKKSSFTKACVPIS